MATHALEFSPMAAGTRNVRILLSQQCFDLLADAMCAYSKKTGRFQTMRMTVQQACERLKSHGISREELNQFLSDYPEAGSIAVWLEVTPQWADAYNVLREKLKNVADKQGADKVAIPFAVYLANANNLF